MSVPAQTEPHVAAVADMLAAQVLTTHVGEAPPGAAAPYLMLWPRAGLPEGTIGDRHRYLLIGFTLTAVGDTPESALIFADRSRSALLTQIPTVAGRAVQPLWVADDGPGLQRDDDVTPHLFYVPVGYLLRSGPA